MITPEDIEKLEKRMAAIRKARKGGDPVAQGEQTCEIRSDGSNSSSGKTAFTFTGEIGGKKTDVRVVPEELTGPSGGSCQVQKLRMTQIRPDCFAQTIVASFPMPARVCEEGIFISVERKDARRKQSIVEVPMDPFLPFRGDKGSRKILTRLGIEI